MQKKTEPTIEPLKSIKDLECKNIGQREGLSKLDIQKINLVYNCKKNAPEAEPEADAAADAWYSGYGHPGYYGAYRRYYGRGWGEYYGGYYGYPSYE